MCSVTRPNSTTPGCWREARHVIRSVGELDGRYLENATWLHGLDEIDAVLDEGVICQAFDENDYEIGHLAIDGDGKILAIEVKPDYRRRGSRRGCLPRSRQLATGSSMTGKTCAAMGRRGPVVSALRRQTSPAAPARCVPRCVPR
jgi:hypothetical protein